jgi:hypothetical protein
LHLRSQFLIEADSGPAGIRYSALFVRIINIICLYLGLSYGSNRRITGFSLMRGCGLRVAQLNHPSFELSVKRDHFCVWMGSLPRSLIPRTTRCG